MIPITPRGIRILPTRSPLGRVHIRITSPTGSGRRATSFRLAAMPRRTESDRVSRSIMAAERPAFLAVRRSSALAFFRAGADRTRASAILSSAEFFTAAERLPRATLAWRAFRATVRISSFRDMEASPSQKPTNLMSAQKSASSSPRRKASA